MTSRIKKRLFVRGNPEADRRAVADLVRVARGSNVPVRQIPVGYSARRRVKGGKRTMTTHPRAPLVFNIYVGANYGEPLPGYEALGYLRTPDDLSDEDAIRMADCLREAADTVDPRTWEAV
jgi:hypothetical protein